MSLCYKLPCADDLHAGHLQDSGGVQVPAGHVWLQGDNTLNSTDSRHYGPVPYALVNGKAFLKVRTSGHMGT